MGLFLMGAFVMFLVAYVAHCRSVDNLGDAFHRVLAVHTEEAYKHGKKQGQMEAMAIISKEADEYVCYRVRHALDAENT